MEVGIKDKLAQKLVQHDAEDVAIMFHGLMVQIVKIMFRKRIVIQYLELGRKEKFAQ
jgi:hypothetical protein